MGRRSLHAASRVFARAQRSRIHAEHAAAADLRAAARNLAGAATEPDGGAATVLLAALLWTAILAARWHDSHRHAQQLEAARRAVHHLQAAYDQAVTSHLAALAQRQPVPDAQAVLAHDVRAAVPDHANHILTDPDWPALATVLADAQADGHRPRELLHEAARQRELRTARRPARVLISRIQHTGRNPAPNRMAEAARMRTTLGSVPQQRTPQSAVPLADPADNQQRRRR